ncbi:hypothetical protein TYRP_017502 [Tyrophagus putrescentiae]|nr:hypothetical protein TYRP_017502 [Tyrophagus putrescentiae]
MILLVKVYANSFNLVDKFLLDDDDTSSQTAVWINSTIGQLNKAVSKVNTVTVIIELACSGQQQHMCVSERLVGKGRSGKEVEVADVVGDNSKAVICLLPYRKMCSVSGGRLGLLTLPSAVSH